MIIDLLPGEEVRVALNNCSLNARVMHLHDGCFIVLGPAWQVTYELGVVAGERQFDILRVAGLEVGCRWQACTDVGGDVVV